MISKGGDDRQLSVIIMLNLKNIEFIEKKMVRWSEGSKINTLSIYRKLLSFYKDKITIINDDNCIDISLEEINTFIIKSGNITSYQAVTTRVNDFNHLFNNILGIPSKFKNISPNEIIKDNKGIYSKEEILAICNSFLNPQDRFLIYGIWFGLKDKRFDDILSIKINDVNFIKNTIKVGEKYVTMDNELSIYTKLAIEQNTYFKMGDVYNANVNDSYFLNMDNPYIIKPKPQKNNSYGKNHMTFNGLRTRISNLEFFSELDIILKPQKLYIGGVLYKMYTESKDKGILWNTVTLNKFKKDKDIKVFSIDTLLAYKEKYGNMGEKYDNKEIKNR